MPTRPGAYSRGYLPHIDHVGMIQFVTFRLADSLPVEVCLQMEQLARQEPTWVSDEVMSLLDAGHGTCLLKDPRAAKIVADALNFYDQTNYRLHAWCIMPNHVHVVVEPFDDFPLAKTVQAWKSFTAHAINVAFDRSGTLWNRDYFDRYMRDGEHLSSTIRYVLDNPVAAGLVDWPWVWVRE